MKIVNKDISLTTKGNTDIIDITPKVKSILADTGLKDGNVTLFVRGSTGSITTIEYEPNLVNDMKDALERLVPSDIEYAHTRTWGDFNGHSHVKASLMGPSMQVPFVNGRLQLGTWQQIVFIDFDDASRSRKLLAQLIGE
jgi:secondary thiamine-phosphate synthase enzyme